MTNETMNHVFDNIEVTDDGHWLYRGRIGKAGYGTISGYLVHRILMRFYAGRELQRNELVCHKNECGRKDCCAPDHLYVGTASSNNRDMSEMWHSKGLMPPQQRNLKQYKIKRRRFATVTQ